MKLRPVALAIGMVLCMPVQSAGRDLVWYGAAEADWNRLDSTAYVNDTVIRFSVDSIDDSGLGYGLFLGARREYDNTFLGGELGLQDGMRDASGSNFGDPLLSLEDNYSVSLSAVGGYRINPKTHLTGRLGYVNTSFDYTAIGITPGYLSDSGDDRLSGVVLGIGILRQLSSRLSIRAEYRHTEYIDDFRTGLAGDPISNNFYEFDDVTRDAFSVGLTLDF